MPRKRSTRLGSERTRRRRAASGAARRDSPYHHGDLPRALLAEALHTIQVRGVGALTLRSVGARIGVSRTALYRHFKSKRALLGAVAAEGFRTLRRKLVAAYAAGQREDRGFEEMGLAYVRFAIEHPSHYRVMFGGFVKKDDIDPDGTNVGAGAFEVLLDAILEQQQTGRVRVDDPRMLAVFVWSVVHGVAMLALDGMLKAPVDAETLMAYANEQLRYGVARLSS